MTESDANNLKMLISEYGTAAFMEGRWNEEQNWHSTLFVRFADVKRELKERIDQAINELLEGGKCK